MSDLSVERVKRRLCTLMPAEAVDDYLRVAMRDAGLATLAAPDDIRRLGEALAQREGKIRILGRALVIEALFAQAKSDSG